MIKVAICDDDQLIAHRFESIICDTCQREGIKADTEVYYSGLSLEKAVLCGERYDLMYLDIQMEKGDGISTARNIRKMDENVIIIFVSSYDKYMMELFQLDVFAFIKKPINMEIFIQTFLKAHERICSRNYFFTFKYKSQEFKIPYKDILYFESKGRQVNVYIRDGEVYIFNGKLSEVEKEIAEGKVPFLRIHQSYLVNYFLIKSRTKASVTLVNGLKLPISEDRQKEFGRAYGKLLRGEVNV